MRFSMIVTIIFPIIIIGIIGIFMVIGINFRKGIQTSTINKRKEGGEDMIKSLYVYLVLFATLMMSIGGSVGAFMSIADLVAPAPYYQSYEDFKRWEIEEKFNETPDKTVIRPSEEEMQEQYDAMITRETERQISRAKNSLIKSFGWILIPLGIFIYFQRNLVRSKE